MKRLLLKIFIMFAFVSIFFISIWFVPGNYTHDLTALINKIDMLKSVKSPRIIFVGGSNLLHLKSQFIEKELKVSVLNLGLWGGLNVKYLLEEIKPYLSSDDVVVIISEYPILLYSFDEEPQAEAKKFFLLTSSKEKIYSYFEKGEYYAVFKDLFELCQLKAKAFLRNILTSNYSHFFKNGNRNYHEQYNKNGDKIAPFPEIRPLVGNKTVYTGSIEINKFSYINDYYDIVSEKNANVFLSFPPIPYKEYKLNEKIINTLHRDLKKYLQCPIVNSPVEHVFPNEYFADTIHHLNEKGELLRTRKLVRELKALLKI